MLQSFNDEERRKRCQIAECSNSWIHDLLKEKRSREYITNEDISLSFSAMSLNV